MNSVCRSSSGSASAIIMILATIIMSQIWHPSCEGFSSQMNQRQHQRQRERQCLQNNSKFQSDVTADSSDHNPQLSSSFSRREILRKSMLSIPFATVTATATLVAQPQPAQAAKGAAEYDLEFYMRDLLKGNNNKEGNIDASKPPPTPPPRRMSPTLVRAILNENANGECITVRTLSKLTGVATEDVSDKITTFRNKAYKAFQMKEPWVEDSVEDEYFFDLTCYALYRVAADLIPSNYALRDQWVREVGREIYSLMKAENFISSSSSSSSSSQNKKLTGTIPTLLQILDFYKSSNFIKGYRLGEKNDDFRTGPNIFDEYDDEDIASGTTVNCLLSLFRPATLGSSLQITGEGSRFSPDFVGSTVSAMWEDRLGGGGNGNLKIEYEGYFVDEEYRPNPKDFFPEEQLLQFSLTPKKK